MWQYNQGLYWCGNGSWITYRAASNNYPSSLGIGWSFVGNMGYRTRTARVTTYGHSTVYANGAGSYSAG